VPPRLRPPGRGGRAALRIVVAAVASAAIVVALIPRVSGAPWAAIGAALSSATVTQVGALAVLWAAGLVVHSRVLTAALPGLTVRRALTLNLTGSAVSNVVPLGGGIGIGMNYLMVRRWGFTRSQFSLFTGLVNTWHVAMKAVLPAVAVALLVADDVLLQRRLLLGAAAVGVLLLATVGLGAAAVLTRRGSRITGRAVDRLLRVARRPVTDSVADRLAGVRAACLELLRSAWRPMTWGVLAYSVLQMGLLWACLAVVGAPVPVVAVVAVFAVERAVTALPLTPGGSGLAEVAATAVLVALGAAPAAAAAGILLYRAFVFGLEIPIGGTWLVGWWLVHRGTAPVTP
jgi:uncharacterized membrane protein YbhN (UPF0104 family)